MSDSESGEEVHPVWAQWVELANRASKAALSKERTSETLHGHNGDADRLEGEGDARPRHSGWASGPNFRSGDMSGEIISEKGMSYSGREGQMREARLQKQARAAGKRYYQEERQYLGSDKGTLEYRDSLENSMSRYEALERKNLLAIVMPGGHGKTWLSRRYGVLDVDDMLTPFEHNSLRRERLEMVSQYSHEWTMHNRRWWDILNDQLDMMDFLLPTVMLVHSEETALEVGAKVIGAIVLESDAHEKNIRSRDWEGQQFSRRSRVVVLNRTESGVSIATSNVDVERLFLQMCNRNEVPIACPYKYSWADRNCHYGPCAPGWVLTGDVAHGNVDQLVSLYEEGTIPKQAVDYYLKQKELTSAFGFGKSINDWSRCLSKLRAGAKGAQRFSLDEDLMEVFPPDSVREANRANLTLRRLQSLGGVLEREDVTEILERHVGERHVFVTSIVSHWLALGSTLPIKGIDKWYQCSFEYWESAMKELHEMFRDSAFYLDAPMHEKDRQKMMYMHLLVGRELYEPSFEDVVAERALPGPEDVCVSFDPVWGAWTREQYDRDFESVLDQVFSKIQAAPRKVNVSSFLSFWEKRRSWITKGSLVHHHLSEGVEEAYVLEVLDEMHSAISRRHTKASLAESEDLMSVLDYVHSEVNLTKLAPKYELGKKRTLLPGSLVHYIIFSYVLFFAEQQDQVANVRLNAPDDNHMRYFESKMVGGAVHFLYDWANFNAQHSARGMARVIEKLGDIRFSPPDYGIFVSSIAEQMFNMVIQGPDEAVKVNRGLFTGWRGTTWINSTMNAIYLAIGELNFERIYGRQAILCADAGGDDVDALVKSGEDGLKLFAVMERIGNEATASKQGLGRNAEFFRVAVSHNYVMGNPTRVLASFVAGNWEGGGNSSILERASALSDQIGKLLRRGCDAEFCKLALRSCLSHWCRIKVDEGWQRLPDTVVHGAKECGGLGVPDDDGDVWILSEMIPESSSSHLELKLPGMLSSTDYVATMEKDLADIGVEIVRKEEFIKKLATASYNVTDLQERARWEELLSFKCDIIGKRKAVERRWNEHLMMLYFDWLHCNKEIMWRKRFAKYVEMQGYLSYQGNELSRAEIARMVYGRLVSEEVLEFKGNVDYRRLVPEFVATYCEEFCVQKLDNGELQLEEAETSFETLCYMHKEIYGHTL